MNNRNFEDLKALIAVLTSGEISTAKRFLTAFDSNVTRNKNKGHALFKLILDRPHVTSEKAKKKVSPEVDDRSFDRQVLRLKDKILETLLIDINTSKKETHEEWFINRMEIRKKYLQGWTIYYRGFQKEAMRLFNKVEEKGREYELYHELVEVLIKKQKSLGFKNGPKDYESFEKDIAFFKRCRDAVDRANDYYNRHFIFDIDQKGINNEKVGFLTEAIADLQTEFEYTKSANVGRNLYNLFSEYYLALEDYSASIEALEKLEELLESSPAIYTKPRIAIVYMDLADSELFRFNFDASERHARRSQENYLFRGFNYQTAKEVEFRAVFYKSDLDRSDKILDELIELSIEQETEFKTSQRKFLKACVMFMKEEYKKCYLYLQEIKEIDADKEGWNIGIRVLGIQCLLELKKWDLADMQIEALRKHTERYNDVIRERDQIILKILLQMEKNSMDFKATWDACLPLLKKISENEAGLRWEVKTPEMIVFQDWFEAKVNGEKYTFKLPDSAKAALEKPRKAKPILPVKLDVAKKATEESVPVAENTKANS